MIETCGLYVGYHGTAILRDVSLSFHPGRVIALLGPNGCGKSSLLRTILGLQPALGGEVLLDKVPLKQLPPKLAAQKAAYLPQSRNVPNISARRMVLHGRFPYLSYPRHYREEDHEAVRQALRQTDAEDVADRMMRELSGGQRQKVYLAMVLAQDTETVFMDEPTTYLDIGHQLDIIRIARQLAEQGKSVVLVLHDLRFALQSVDEAVVLHNGGVQMCGTPDELFASGVMDTVFGITLLRVQTEQGWQYYYGDKP